MIGARAAALAAATALASPYLFVYDMLILVVPFLWLVQRGRHRLLLALAWAILLLGLVQVARLERRPESGAARADHPARPDPASAARLERVGERDRAAAARRRFGLTGRGRPAGEVDDLEPLDGAALLLEIRGRRGEAACARTAAGRARRGCWSRPRPAGRRSGWRRPGSADRAARCRRRAGRSRRGSRRSPAARTSIWGWMRGAAGRPSAASAARSARRSRGRLPAPRKAARNRPSGRSARRIWISAPGRSLTVSSAPAETIRSNDAAREGEAILVRVGAGHPQAALAQPLRRDSAARRDRARRRRAASPDRAARPARRPCGGTDSRRRRAPRGRGAAGAGARSKGPSGSTPPL